MAEPPPDPDRFEEAVAAFRRRMPDLTDDEIDEIVSAAEEQAFRVAGVTEARVVQQVFDALERAIADGTTLEDFQDEVGGALAESWGGEDPGLLETVFRTNVMAAYNGGRSDVFSDPDVQDARSYLRFDAVEDSRTSDICDALHGVVLPADDPFWRTHTPPLHHNCRSILTPLTEDEAADEGVTKGRPETRGLGPDDGFGRPADAENWEPDLDQFDRDLRDVLSGKLDE